MVKYEIGVRKQTNRLYVRSWMIINAKPVAHDREDTIPRIKSSKKTWPSMLLQLTDHPYWILFILFTIIVNTFITINCFPYTQNSYIVCFATIVHLTCFFYWIDFVLAVTHKLLAKRKGLGVAQRETKFLVVDALSLLPFPLIYLVVVQDPNIMLFWILRSITLLRFYRIPQYLSKMSTVERNHWMTLVVAYVFYTVMLIDIFTSYWLMQKDTTYDIYQWDSTTINHVIVCLYFSVVTTLNIGFGDITPQTELQIIICCCFMVAGFILISGVVTGALATGFATKEKKREIYRVQYESTMIALRRGKIEKNVIDKISDNLLMYWKHKKGFTTSTASNMLPLSMQKEIYYDVNFGFLNRSLIFSLQPRSFLRSVSLMMKNLSFFPGDIIVHPSGIREMMLCVASGVIEVLSEENDETPLLSFTTGTIIGEAVLFLSIPVKSIIRASTYVELQVLMKVNFSQMALKYPEIYRKMRRETLKRLKFVEEEAFQNLDPDVSEITKRKATKRLIKELKRSKIGERQEQNTQRNSLKTNLLDLYVLSENIPRAKTLPINLIRARPWILRPDTTLMRLWEFFIVIVVTIVCYTYPYLAGFVRKISSETYVTLFLIEITYVTDLFLQLTTAIERNDHFTFITSIKQIIAHKLKSLSFYFDVLATYDFTIYSKFIMPKDEDYGCLLLSLNRVLKFWHIPRYFEKLENNVSFNLLALRTFKYFLYYTVIVIWTSSILFLVACPGEVCVEQRWYARLEVREVNLSVLHPRSEWPAVVSLYWGSVIVSAVGYGDLVPKSIPDCLAVLLSIILGVFITTYCTAQASATLKHLVRHRTRYQEEVFAVNRFMTEHEIPQDLQNRVRNYFRMQWNYDKGFSLKQHQLIEGMTAKHRDIILAVLIQKFMAVPVFQQTDNNFLRLLAKSCKMRLLPPDEVIVHSGSSLRELYILENGYCEVSTDGNTSVVIGPLSPFGYVEMILGAPLQINVLTLTHARIICLDYSSYLRAATKFPTIKTEIDSKIEEIYELTMQRGLPLDILKLNPLPFVANQSHDRAVTESYLSGEFINVYKFHKNFSTNYWEPFKNWGKFRFFQFFLLPIVITPHSLFLKIWASFRILNVLLTSCLAPIYFSLPYHTQDLRTVILTLQGLAALDMYLMFHVAYYDSRGLLMFHPAKTATWYLKNTFVLDLITTFPIYLVTKLIFPGNDGVPRFLQDAPGFIMVLQFYKFFQGCYYLENDILRPLPHLRTLKSIPVSIVFTNIMTGFLILIECHTTFYEKTSASVGHSLQTEFEEGVTVFCSTKKTDEHFDLMNGTSPFRFYLIAYYWVTTTMTTCGFGDVAAHNCTTMIIVMIIIIFGLFLYGYMLASLTSTMISAYNSVTKYRRRILEMSHFMKQMNANDEIQQKLILHYEYNWQRNEGNTPQKMLLYVHAALREAIVASMYGETISQVPAFLGVEKSVIRVIGKYSEEMYFLGGETIVKYKDIQEYIYLIYRGKVDVISRNGRVKASMGSGGIFGNISEKPFSLSSVAVIATKNVDILRVNSRTFFKELKMIPNTKQLIQFLNSRTTDYIKPLNETRDSTESETLPYEITATKLAVGSVYASDFSIPNQILRFYLKNSIFLPPGRNLMKLVILHDSWLYKVIEVSVFLAAYLSSTLTFYSFCFQDLQLWVIVLSYILDVVFFCKILLQFNLSYFDKYGNYVISKRKIKKRYFNQKKTLGFDIAANFPLDFLALFCGNKKLLVLTILRLNRILRAYYIFQLYDLKYKVLMINKIYLKLTWILCNTGLLVHFFACFWYFITCPFGVKLIPTWVTNMNKSNATNNYLYLNSIYYIITLTTTTGYGQLKIISNIEIIVSTIFMIACRFGMALLAGSMAAVISVHSINLSMYQELISDLREDFRRQKISLYQLSKMWNYVTSLWLKKFRKKIPKFIETAPHVMRCEVMNSMFGHHLSQSYLFSQMDEAFLKQLAIHFKQFIYFPGNYIVQQGDIDHTMYFIHKGEVSVLTIHPNLTETIHYKLEENDHFGMTQGLIMEAAHRFSYRAETEVEMLSLTLNHWQSLLKYFPEIGQQIYQRLQSLPH